MLMKSRLLGDPKTTDVTIQYYEKQMETPVDTWRAHANVLRAKSKVFAASLDKTKVRAKRPIRRGLPARTTR